MEHRQIFAGTYANYLWLFICEKRPSLLSGRGSHTHVYNSEAKGVFSQPFLIINEHRGALSRSFVQKLKPSFSSID
jgi:threonine aldolase